MPRFSLGSLSRWLVFAALLSACAPTASPGGAPGPASTADRPAEPKKVTVAMRGNPAALSRTLTPGSSVSGMHSLEEIVHVGVANHDNGGVARPILVEAIPTLENGLWKLLPDGRMETTWKVKPGVVWHDGTLFTADDLLFTTVVGRDTSTPIAQDRAYRNVGNVEAPDPRTLVVTWSRPYIDANLMFTRSRLFQLPLPKHLLERPYLEEKARFTELSYWNEEFVGLGPFKLREFARGTHMLFDANDRYVLGRPKIDVVEVKIFPDANSMLANILAGTVDVTLDRAGLSLDEAFQVSNQWTEGALISVPSSLIWLWIQFVNPTPPVLADARFRRAVLQTIDRQELVDTFTYGQGSVAHSHLDPQETSYRDADRRVTKYPYDLAAAGRTIESLGYTKGPDGTYRDRAGQPLNLEIRSTNTQPGQKAMLIIANFWKTAGMPTDTVNIAPQQQEDREYRATFPAFATQRGSYGIDGIDASHSREAPFAENGWFGKSLGRFQSPQLDTLIERLENTIAQRDRLAIWSDILAHTTDQLNILPLWYDVAITLAARRVTGVTGSQTASTDTWNIEQWDIVR